MARSTTIKVDRFKLMERVEAKIAEADAQSAAENAEREANFADLKKRAAKERRALEKEWRKYATDILAALEDGGLDALFPENPRRSESYRYMGFVEPSGSLRADRFFPEAVPPVDRAARHRRVLSQLEMSNQPTISVSLDNTFGEYL